METDDSSVVRIVSHGAALGAYARLISLDGVPRYRVAGGWLSDLLRGGAEKPVAFVLHHAVRGWTPPRAFADTSFALPVDKRAGARRRCRAGGGVRAAAVSCLSNSINYNIR